MSRRTKVRRFFFVIAENALFNRDKNNDENSTIIYDIYRVNDSKKNLVLIINRNFFSY